MNHRHKQVGQVGRSPIEIGRYTYGMENILVKEWGEGARLVIGSFCSIAASITVFLGGNHRTDWITTFPFGHMYSEDLGGQDITGHPSTKGDVIIGDDVWIGHGVTVMSGVRIATGAVIAANATVVRDVGTYEIHGGNPAKLAKKRFDDPTIELLLKLRWWDLPVEDIRSVTQELSSPPTPELLESLIKRFRPD